MFPLIIIKSVNDAVYNGTKKLEQDNKPEPGILKFEVSDAISGILKLFPLSLLPGTKPICYQLSYPCLDKDLALATN